VRRWELVGDGSAKFWEAVADGASVQVRYGRIGTAGRVQVKEFADPAAAGAHLAKLVAEKERKGYLETGAADALPAASPAAPPAASAPSVEQPAQPLAGAVEGAVADAQDAEGPETPEDLADDAEFAELPDEDGPFTLPQSWYPLVVPRRGGGVPVGPARPVVDAAAAEERESLRVAKNESRIEQMLEDPKSDRQLVQAARAHLRGMPDPAGAAVIAALQRETWQRGGFQEVVDSWIARFGLGFAARATVESFQFDAEGTRPGHHRTALVSGGPAYRSLQESEFPLGLARGVRQALASAASDTVVADLNVFAALLTRLARAEYRTPVGYGDRVEKK